MARSERDNRSFPVHTPCSLSLPRKSHPALWSTAVSLATTVYDVKTNASCEPMQVAR